jgi:hypothetical protein
MKLRKSNSLVGKDMERTLFTLPTYEADINPYKETFTKNTAITGNLLINLWQKNKDDKNIYKITNLTAMAETLQVTPQELKLYLIYLGVYQYPKITAYTDERGRKIISIYSDKLFYIKFNILYQDGETKDNFTNYCSFIKDRAIDSVEVMPSQSIQEDLRTFKKGQHAEGLGNVLVDDSFVAFSLGLNELAYKLLSLTGSHRPSFKIGFNKLITQKYLNLEKQLKGVYTQTGKRLRAGKGKPKILARIQEALTELQTKGHLTSWGYDEATDMFSWTYSSKIIKHKELLPPKPAVEETGQTGQ